MKHLFPQVEIIRFITLYLIHRQSKVGKVVYSGIVSHTHSVPLSYYKSVGGVGGGK